MQICLQLYLSAAVSVLLELKNILMEAKQKIPPNLESQEGDYLKLGGMQDML